MMELLIVIFIYMFTYIYFLLFKCHLDAVKQYAWCHECRMEKINFKEFKILFNQRIWRTRGKHFKGSYFSFDPLDYKNHIHGDAIVINGISYRLKWYSYLSFLIWKRKKYNPNPNLLMAHL